MAVCQPIVLYDLLREGPDAASRTFSPNVWKTRVVMNIKHIAHKTVSLDFTEVEPTLKKLNIPPNATGFKYTVPAIYDPNTGKSLMDSAAILLYLEEQYPRSPSLFPPRTKALQMFFLEKIETRCLMTVFPLMVMDLLPRFTKTGAQYFRETREAAFGCKLEDVYVTGEKRLEQLNKLVDVLRELAKLMGDSPFVTGDVPSAADAYIISWVAFVINGVGRDHDASRLILTVSGGRWGRYWDGVSRYTAVH